MTRWRPSGRAVALVVVAAVAAILAAVGISSGADPVGVGFIAILAVAAAAAVSPRSPS